VGKVWPGAVHFPDFWHPKTEDYWTKQFLSLHEKLNFSGIWLDMNEAANFCEADCNFTYSELHDDNRKYAGLIYIPGEHSLEHMSISLDALHYSNVEEYNVHNLFGLLQIRATYNALKQTGFELPFILTRSSSTGAGKFAAHWLGDNESTWDFMKQSIGGVLNMQIFGLPFVGADVCGFGKSTTPELCSRWVQLGSMHPFFRNHNILEGDDQEFFN